MIEEIWKLVPGYESLYQVSNLGRVRSLGRISLRGHRLQPRILRPGIAKGRTRKSGYLVVALHKDGAQKSFFVHRLVALMFVPNPNEYPEVDHVDTDKKNCRWDNLEWVTALENHRRARRKGIYKEADFHHGQRLAAYWQGRGRNYPTTHSKPK